MRKQRKRSQAPWVVEPEHLLRWALRKLPVRYKWKTMYLSQTKMADDQVLLYEKKPNRNGVECWKLHIANADDITLLI